jgi:hypothetical protein
MAKHNNGAQAGFVIKAGSCSFKIGEREQGYKVTI